MATTSVVAGGGDATAPGAQAALAYPVHLRLGERPLQSISPFMGFAARCSPVHPL